MQNENSVQNLDSTFKGVLKLAELGFTCDQIMQIACPDLDSGCSKSNSSAVL